MPISLDQIARAVQGRLRGDPAKTLAGVALIDDATDDQLSFCDDPRTLAVLHSAEFAAGAVLVPRNYLGPRDNVIEVDDPQAACARAIGLFHPATRPPPEISPRAEVHPTAVLGREVHLAPFATVGARASLGDRVTLEGAAAVGAGVVIGDDTRVGARAIILPGTRIGCRVVIGPGSIVGAEGFGYVVEPGAPPLRIPHVGEVVIEDDVEIGPGNTIERANLGRTLICQGVKTGAQVHLGHNVTLGRETRVVAQAGIGGNTTVGERVLIGGQAGIEQNLIIGDDAVIGPQAGVVRDVGPGEQVYGTPGMSRGAWLRSAFLLPRLAQMRTELARLSKRLDALFARRPA